MKIGGKTSLVPEKKEMIQGLTEIVDFIEIYFGRKRMLLEEIKSFDTRWVVHGPHVSQGVNFSKPTNEGTEIFKESIVLARDLGAKYVVTHPGFFKINDDKEKMLEAMTENFLEMKDFAGENSVQLLIENLMTEDFYFVVNGSDKIPDYYFVSTPEEMKIMTKKLNVGFVLDFSHAFMSSRYHNLDYKKFMKDFVSLDPVMFHMNDSKLENKIELHLPLGQGNYDIKFFASLIGDKDVTLEVSSTSGPPVINDFISSIDYLKSIGVKL